MLGVHTETKEMRKLMIASAEKSGMKVTNVRLQPLVTWLHFLNFVTIAIICLLCLKIYKAVLVMYAWLFPFRHVSECPVILVVGPKNDLIQEIIYQLSQTFGSEITVCQDLNDNALEELKPKRESRKSQIICSHEPVSSQAAVADLRRRVEKAFGFVDILVISQNEDERGGSRGSTHAFLNNLNKQLLSQFWTVMAFLPGMLRRNKGHILSVALGRASLTNTGIMRTIHEELLQCETNVKLTLIESNAILDSQYLPSLSSDVLASLILRSMWDSSTVVKVPSIPCYLIMLPVLLVRSLLRPLVALIQIAAERSF